MNTVLCGKVHDGLGGKSTGYRHMAWLSYKMLYDFRHHHLTSIGSSSVAQGYFLSILTMPHMNSSLPNR